MPTIEERLAALETKLAALTETTPTTYYEHQYSGEEIDAAVGRALTGGALDTSVTNVSNQLGTFVRPNLFDNAYFLRPVNQRGETSYNDTFVYTVDRWQTGEHMQVDVGAGGITLTGNSNITQSYLFQRIERLFVAQYTISILFEGNTSIVALTNNATDRGIVQIASTESDAGLLSLTWRQDVEVDQSQGYFRINCPGRAKILAAKLELGPTQTLAHKEGDKWVLNEVPDYGEQLRRCQRYQFEVFDRTFAGQGYLAQVKAIDSTQAYGVLPTPVTMREDGIPALVTDCSAANPYGAFGIYSTGYSSGIGMIAGLSLFSKVQNGVILRAVGSNFVAGNDYQIWVDNQNAHQFLLNYNL